MQTFRKLEKGHDMLEHYVNTFLESYFQTLKEYMEFDTLTISECIYIVKNAVYAIMYKSAFPLTKEHMQYHTILFLVLAKVSQIVNNHIIIAAVVDKLYGDSWFHEECTPYTEITYLS